MNRIFILLVAVLCFAGMTVQAQQRKVLVEEFTASTCPPCKQLNALLNPWLAANAEKVVVVKYQMNYPGSGDPYYTPECGVRHSYYNVGGVPAPFVNGIAPNDNVQTYQQWMNNIAADINAAYTQPAQATITGTFAVNGNNIIIEGSVTPLISGSGYKIYVIADEKTTYGNKKTNGETEFHHVMMKMFPDGGGTAVTLTAGTPIPFSYTYDMSSTHVEEMDDLEVAVFVQNVSTRAVLNAAYLCPEIEPPTNLTAEQLDKNVILTWTASDGAEHYTVYYDGNVLQDDVTTTTYTHQNVPSGEHTYEISAVINECASDVATVTLEVTSCDPPTDPVAAQEGADVVLTWTAPDDDSNYYNVYLDGTLYEENIIETTFTLAQVPVGEHIFGVTSVTDDCESDMATVTLEVTDGDTCDPPTALDAVQEDANVILTWEAPADEVDSYNVYLDGELQTNTAETTYTFVDAPEGTHLYGVSAIVGECESEIAEIEFETTTGISEQEAAFSIFPNPADDYLQITGNYIHEIALYNIVGQMVENVTVNDNHCRIATDTLNSGIYFIKIYSADDQVYTRKIVIK